MLCEFYRHAGSESGQARYCRQLLLLAGTPKAVTDKLQCVMNSTAQVITNTWKFDHGLLHIVPMYFCSQE